MDQDSALNVPVVKTMEEQKRSPLLLSVVVPTFNERENVTELVRRLEGILVNVNWEIIFVDDDSPDGTTDLLRLLAQSKPYVRCLQRIGRRGLSRAVIEGALSTSAEFILVMDADLQHDESIIPVMLGHMRDTHVDLVLGSRYCDGAGVGTWDSKRVAISAFATKLSRLIIKDRLTDPMSGFFLVRREIFQRLARQLSGEGYKILLDLVASSKEPLHIVEVSYIFRERVAGESKLDSAVIWEYLLLLADKRSGRIVPARFVLFSLVGMFGVIVHFVSLSIAFKIFAVDFTTAQTSATIIAIANNYVMNNALTYRDRRLVGLRFVTGLVSFYVICGIGVVANVGIANFVFKQEYTWWIAGGAGALVGSVWNYAASSMFTWRQR